MQETEEPEAKPSIPESLLAKLFDATGTLDGAQRGYLIFYINEQGEPYLTSRYENTAVQFALEKAMEIYQDNQGIGFTFGGEE
jgi:hypothetical protein